MIYKPHHFPSAVLFSQSRHGFTITELCVVVSLLVLLLGVSLPAVQKVRERSRSLQCENHLREIGLACNQFHSQRNRFPSPGFEDLARIEEPKHRAADFSFLLQITPYLDNSRLDPVPKYASEVRQKAGNFPFPQLQCPSAWQPTALQPSVTHYLSDETTILWTADYRGNGGTYDTVQSAGRGPLKLIGRKNATVRFRSIRDGTSNTILAWESAGGKLVDTKGRELGSINQFGWNQFTLVFDRGNAKTFPGLKHSRTFLYSWTGFNIGYLTFLDRDGNAAAPLAPGSRLSLNHSNEHREPFSLHPETFNVAFADGHTIRLSETIDPQLMKALVTMAESEIVSLQH